MLECKGLNPKLNRTFCQWKVAHLTPLSLSWISLNRLDFANSFWLTNSHSSSNWFSRKYCGAFGPSCTPWVSCKRYWSTRKKLIALKTYPFIFWYYEPKQNHNSAINISVLDLELIQSSHFSALQPRYSNLPIFALIIFQLLLRTSPRSRRFSFKVSDNYRQKLIF